MDESYNKSKIPGIAVIGLGFMGSLHLKDIEKSENMKLIAVCDINRELADKVSKQYGVKAYYDEKELLTNKDVEGIIVTTPHYKHTGIVVEAFRKGINVLVEKPVGVHINDVKKMIDAYEKAKQQKKDLIFTAMFQMRTYGYWKKIKDIIDSGELGRLIRTTWIITNWFRTQFYYDSGSWRATWAGEGGGVLVNQCPHQLDLYQWLVGMPDRIRGFASFGKYHDIEVEDEVTAYFEHDNGMVGHFITTTAEAPGTNRLEIVGEKGKLVFEYDSIIFYRNRESCLQRLNNSKKNFDTIENWKIDIPYAHHGEQGHRFILENFANAIRNKEDLLVNGSDGLNSVMIANGILLSSLKNQTLDIPIDGDVFEEELKMLINNSRPGKKRDISFKG